MARFLKVIRTCAPNRTMTLSDLADEHGIVAQKEGANVLINLDEVSNIQIQKSKDVPTAVEIVMWTTKICFTWRFLSTDEAAKFYSNLQRWLPMAETPTSSLRGFKP
jgi:hypothetical protein